MRRLMQTRLGVFALAIGVAASAHAASPDPRGGHDRMEDALVDGDIDAEDFVSWRVGRQSSLVGGRAGAYLALSAFLTHGGGGQERGGMLVLQLPFDRLFVPASAPRLAPIAEQTAPPAPAPPAPATAVVAAAVTVSPADARACVQAALRAAGLGDEVRLASIASRARASAAFPELRLRALRNVDQSGRVTYTDLDPNRYSEAGATGYTLEARLTFRLDRLLFADEEVSIERMRADRQEVRTRIAAKALTALFEWQRAHLLEKSPTLTTDEHLAAALREAEAAAMLDVMTDGWFSRWRTPADGAAETK